MDNDKLLIEKITTGDLNQFKYLINKYQRLVMHIAFRIIENETDREDICQDIFLRIYQNLSKFKFEAKLSTWIARIAYNTCISHIDKKKVPLFDDVTVEDQLLENYSEDNPQPDKISEIKDTSIHIQSEINELPIQLRVILTLYHIDEMKYSEISKIMDLPEGTVKSYLFRARKLLKERLLAKYKQEELWH